MNTLRALAAVVAVSGVVAAHQHAYGSSLKIMEHLSAFQNASAELVDLHKRSAALSKEIQAAAEIRNRAHVAMEKALRNMDLEDTDHGKVAEKVIQGIRDANEEHTEAHLEALNAHAEAAHELAADIHGGR